MREQPALDPAGDAPARGRPVPASGREALCLMRDGTWQTVKVIAWQQDDGGRWRCLLQWGIAGSVYESWYIHDPDRMHPVK